MCITYIRFHKACKVQGLDRKSLPYTGYLQPFCAWYGLVWMTLVTLFYGYAVFRNGAWSTKTFFGSYCILGVDAIIFVIWKIWHRTKFIKPNDVDLVWERPTIDAYEATFIDPPVGFWRGAYMILNRAFETLLLTTEQKCCNFSAFTKSRAAMISGSARSPTERQAICLVSKSAAIAMCGRCTAPDIW